MTFNFRDYLEEGFKAQDDLAIASGEKQLSELTNNERYAKVIEMIGHLTEEVNGEVRKHVKRRPWRTVETGFLDDQEHYHQFLDEMVDVLLFFRAILVFGDISPDQFINALETKLNYNKVRKDHVRIVR